jgi:hypothetical protein
VKSIILPATIAVAILFARQLASKTAQMPRPYQLAGAGIIYTGAGLLSEANEGMGMAVAWGYLVALILAPGSSDLLGLIGGGVAKVSPTATPTTTTTSGGASSG